MMGSGVKNAFGGSTHLSYEWHQLLGFGSWALLNHYRRGRLSVAALELAVTTGPEHAFVQ